MKKKFIFISFIFLIIFITLGYVFKYKINRNHYQIVKKQEIKELYNKELLGTDLISIINKALDYNKNLRINNEINELDKLNFDKEIKIDVKFKDLNKNISMEKINKIGIKKFVKNFGNYYFKCIEINFYEENGQVKYILFEEI